MTSMLHLIYKIVSCRLTEGSFKQLPPMPGVHHFSNGVTRLKYLTAQGLNTILRVRDHFASCLDIKLTNGPVSATTSCRNSKRG